MSLLTRIRVLDGCSSRFVRQGFWRGTDTVCLYAIACFDSGIMSRGFLGKYGCKYGSRRIGKMEEFETGIDNVEYREILRNIRRLTVFTLDALEEGSRKKTLEDREKRLLTSNATRLLRLWKSTMKEAGSKDSRHIPETDTQSHTSKR